MFSIPLTLLTLLLAIRILNFHFTSLEQRNLAFEIGRVLATHILANLPQIAFLWWDNGLQGIYRSSIRIWLRRSYKLTRLQVSCFVEFVFKYFWLNLNFLVWCQSIRYPTVPHDRFLVIWLYCFSLALLYLRFFCLLVFWWFNAFCIQFASLGRYSLNLVGLFAIRSFFTLLLDKGFWWDNSSDSDSYSSITLALSLGCLTVTSSSSETNRSFTGSTPDSCIRHYLTFVVAF